MIEGSRLLRDFRTLFDSGTLGDLSDAQLLDRFAVRRGEAEAAFEALVARHAPMVLGVCRRVLRDPNDVDDAFQATFLILATRAPSIRERAALGGWLARVALRVALRADRQGKRRRELERRAAGADDRASVPSTDREEARSAVDEEVDRLPERFRRPVVLCYLEGLTHDEAALRLACPVGTVRSRLSRARDRLKARLTRRGLAPADFALLAPLPASASANSAATLAALRPSTASAAAILLKKGVLMTMLWARWKRAGLLLIACGSTAAAVAFEAIPATEPMVVEPGPLRRVHVKIVGGGYPVPTYGWKFFSKVSLAPRPDLPDLRLPLIDRELKSKGVPDGIVVEEDLPEGTYQLEVRHEGQVEQHREVFGKATRELVVTAGEGPLNLPNLYLVSLAFDKWIGQPAPEIDAADHDTERPVKLADDRGKVILLAFECDDMLSEHVTYLVDLQRKFAGRPLAIVALHDQSLKSRAEYDRMFARLQSEKAIKAWRGLDLPFRVLKDRPDPEKPDQVKPEGHGATIKRYDVRSFPTVLLIDHEGKLVAPVAYHDRDRLESLVRTLVEKAEASRMPPDPKAGLK